MRSPSRFAFGSLVLSGLLALAMLLPTGTASATAITNGTINFTVTSGGPVPTGSFIWNGTTNTWESFLVNWDGATFDFAPQFSSLADFNEMNIFPDEERWCANGPTPSGRPAGTGVCDWALFTLGHQTIIPEQNSFSDPSAKAYGDYTVTETSVAAVPEPAVWGMFGFGLLLVGGFVTLRRRNGGDIA